MNVVIMKTHFFTKLIAGCFSMLLLISCESHVQNTDEAFERVKEKKMMSNDTSFYDPMEESKDMILVKKAKRKDEGGITQGNSNEYALFKCDLEKKILKNEKMIKEIKIIPAEKSGLLLYRKVIRLEKENNTLKNQLDEYNNEMKLRWENFKKKMEQEANEINAELKEINVNSKKQ